MPAIDDPESGPLPCVRRNVPGPTATVTPDGPGTLPIFERIVNRILAPVFDYAERRVDEKGE